MSLKFEIKRFHIALAVLGICALALLFKLSRKSGEPQPEQKPESVALFLPQLQPKQAPKEDQLQKKPVSLPKPAPVSVLKSTVTFWSTMVNPSTKTVALTFDDGPHPDYTERLLAVLKSNGVSATFFMVGKQVEKYPNLVQRIFQEGHELGNHTYSHKNMRHLTDSEIESELGKAHTLVQSITEQKMRFFRPPGGQYNENVVKYAREHGYRVVLWNVFPRDHTNPAAQTIRDRVLKTKETNAIILFHSGIENTLQVLPEIIVEFKKKGYKFVTVSELFDNSQFNHKPVTKVPQLLSKP